MSSSVTVIIPSYNPGLYLRDALTSVLQQTRTDWRLLLIDDGSTDDSVEHASDLLDDPRIAVLRNEVNIGQAMTLNRGLDCTDTEFFFQLDADDWLQPHAIQAFLAVGMLADENLALVISNVIEHTQETGHQRTIRQGKWGKTYSNRYQMILANLFPWQKFYRTKALRAIGGWPSKGESNWRNVEDLAIFLRLIETYSFCWLDEALLFYRIHKSNITADRTKTANGVEWLIRDALKRWGDAYAPIFYTTPDGYKMLGGLLSHRLE